MLFCSERGCPPQLKSEMPAAAEKPYLYTLTASCRHIQVSRCGGCSRPAFFPKAPVEVRQQGSLS